MDETEKRRTKCEIWQRVTGYCRPVSQFNAGKKSEFYNRSYVDLEKTMSSFAQDNKNFNDQYLTE